MLIGRHNHPLLGGELSPEDFAALTHLLVSQRGDAFGIVDSRLREVGLSRRISITVPHFLAAPFIVGATDVVAVMAERVARRLAEAAGVSIYRMPVLIPPWTVGLARLKDTHDPAIDWLADLISAISVDI